MRIAVDVTPMFGMRTGVGRFTTELATRLARRDDLELVALSVTWRGRDERPPGLPSNVALAAFAAPARSLHWLWRFAPWPPVESRTGEVAVVHGTNYVVPPARRAGRLATVHDLTLVRHPELAEPAAAGFWPLVRAAVRRGAHLHTVSQFVADELLDELAGATGPDRVHVVPNGVEPVAGDAARGRRLVGEAPFALAVGAIEPRKQLPLLVRAFDDVAARNAELRLVVAGPDGWGVEAFESAVTSAAHRERIIRIGWVDDRTRGDLLAAAAMLAFPSIYEGFGLPPLEAMAAGTPVVAARAGAIPEVVGDAALLVDPGNADELAEAIERLLTDEDLRRGFIASGRKRAAEFTWDRTANEMAAVYANLVDRD